MASKQWNLRFRRRFTWNFMAFDGFQTLDFGAFLAPPHERPKKGSRTLFLILKTRFPGGLPEMDFRAFSVSSRLGAHKYAAILSRSGSLGAQKYDKIRRFGRLWAQKYDILMAWE